MSLHKLTITTAQNRQVVDITEQLAELVLPENTLVNVFAAHTTCAITTADLDPGTDLDLLDSVWEMIPKLKFRHAHNPEHTPAHMASSIIGPDVTVPIENGKLRLGQWQRIVLVELDGPRDRDVIATTS